MKQVIKTKVTYSAGYKALHKMVAKAKFFDLVWMVCVIYFLAELLLEHVFLMELKVDLWISIPCFISAFYLSVKYSDAWAHRWMEMWASKEVSNAVGDGK